MNPASVFFISDIVVFIPRSSIWIYFIYSVSLLNFWTYRVQVIITLLMFFAANSNICVSFGSVSMDWFSSLWIMSSCLFVIPIILFELRSGKQLSYLDMVWSFWILFLRFVRQVQSTAHSRANYSLLQRQDLPEYSTQCLMNYEIFLSSWW